MKQTFPEYYPLEDAERLRIENEAIIALDASALLHAYRLAPSTAAGWLGLLEELSDRLWVPHQAALEYQRARIGVVALQREVVRQVKDAIERGTTTLEEGLTKQRTAVDRSALLSWQSLSDALAQSRGMFQQIVETAELQAVDLNEAMEATDEVHKRITSLLDGKVGDPFDDERRTKVVNDGRQRYRSRIPPGFEDSKKEPEERAYGDLIIWLQLMEHAKAHNSPAVLITEDTKGDWWRKAGEEALGAHPLLRTEFGDCVGQPFWLYRVARFMNEAEAFGATAREAAASDAAALEAESTSPEPSEPLDSERLRSLVEALELAGGDGAWIDEERQGRLVAVLARLTDEELTRND